MGDHTRTLGGGDSPAAPAPALARGSVVGRYVLDRLLGAGGMGMVYAARDPSLDRQVAVKLIRPASDGRAALVRWSRLIAEARAMARLSHPNVVTVFEAGTDQGQAFLAMELVDGLTLAEWLAHQRRPWRETVRMCLQAGRGLQAAHAAGVVHRDFKPSNVLVSRSGVARVTDFGLAQLRDTAAGADGPEAPAALEGTPAYMAPEQLRGAPADTRTDQYAFCAVLHEALHGTLPTPGAPGPAPLPRRLQRLLQRGLSSAPEARHPSMEALLDELEALARPPARKVWVAAVAAGAILGAGAFPAARLYEERRCAEAGRALDGIWDGEARDGVRRAFLATGAPIATEAFASVDRTLARYAAEWRAARLETCLAARVRRDRSDRVHARATACLEARREGFGQVIGLLRAATAEVVVEAPTAVHGLEPVAACADPQGPEVAGPEGAVAAGPAASRARRWLSEVKALLHTGQWTKAAAGAPGAVEAARAAGSRALEAEALLASGWAYGRAGDFKAAEASLREAVWAAQAGRAELVEARAWIELLGLVGGRMAPEEGERLRRHAFATMERLGGHPDLEIELYLSSGDAYVAQLRHQDALEANRKALELAERRHGAGSWRIAGPANNVGAALMAVGRHEEALAMHRRALAARESELGPRHADVAGSLHNIARVYREWGKPEQALEHATRAMELWEQAVGKDHPRYGRGAHNMAAILSQLGRHPEALGWCRISLGVIERTMGPGHSEEGPVRSLEGTVLGELGQAGPALAAHRRAVEIAERGGNPLAIAAARAAQDKTLSRLGR